MKDGARPLRDRLEIVAVAASAVQWLLLTIALGAIVIYTDRSMEGMIGYHLDGGYAFFGAILIGFLMGATIERSTALVVMVFLSCVCAAGMYVAVLYYPVWTGKLVETIGLENFATTRALLYFVLTSIPMSLGAMAGRLAGSFLPGGDLRASASKQSETRWWLDRTPSDDAETTVR